MKQKVITGEFRYCQKAMKSWLLMGYKITKAKRWSDGRYTYVLESNEDHHTYYVGHKPYTVT
jgi:hypothetical protein